VSRERNDKSQRPRIQYAALPFRMVDGQPQIMLVTSRETRRWILPKGKPEKNVPARDVAAQEGYEEAGLVGSISVKPVGSFPSTKRLRSGEEVATRVRVYMLLPVRELDEWPEKSQRDRRWLSPSEAVLLASEPGLADFLLRFAALWS
jgi:8-oxo-dGTP pyrophosphatase MutT (NUDIX family)